MPQKARMGLTFLSASTQRVQVPGAVTIQGIGSDSVLYSASSASSFYLPLKNAADSTAFNIAITNDTLTLSTELTVWHKNKPQLVSEECGCVVFHVIDSIRFTLLPESWNVSIYDSNVLNVENASHVHVTLP